MMSEVTLNKCILAVVTTNPGKVSSGSIPTFYCESDEELERIASLLTRITNGMVHDLGNGVYILVRH